MYGSIQALHIVVGSSIEWQLAPTRPRMLIVPAFAFPHAEILCYLVLGQLPMLFWVCSGGPHRPIHKDDLKCCLEDVMRGTSAANQEMRAKLKALDQEAQATGTGQADLWLKQSMTVVDKIMEVEETVLLPAVRRWGICPLYRPKLKVCLNIMHEDALQTNKSGQASQSHLFQRRV